jgi:hypothetical protein
MGEKQILTEAMIDEKLNSMRPQEIRYIDPMKMAQWTIERACAMVDNAVGVRRVDDAIKCGELEAYRVGKFITVEPQKFLLWYRRHLK